MTFKTLGAENVTIRPFKVHKSQVITYVSGANAVAEMNVATAIRFPLVTSFITGTIGSGANSGSQVILTQSVLDLNGFAVETSPRSEDTTFQEPLFSTVEHTFYTSGAESGSATFAAGGDGIRNFPLSESVYVVNIAQRMWGEGIRPGTFTLSTPAAGTGTIFDDGLGRLYVSGSGSVGSPGPVNIVGNVFYTLGVAVINRLTGSNGSNIIQETGMFFDDGDTLQTNFDATMKLFEYTILASMDPFEFNYSMNPTFTKRTFTGSVDIPAEKVIDLVASGTLSPYITSIGLYNDRQQLVAVARLPNPIRRLVNSQQSVIIKFDV